MPKLKPTEKEMGNRERRAILAAGQEREAVSDSSLAKYMGKTLRTYQRRKSAPGDFSLDEVLVVIKKLHLSDQEILTLVKGSRC